MSLRIAALVVVAFLVAGCQQTTVKKEAKGERSTDFATCLAKARAEAGSEAIGKSKVIQGKDDLAYEQKLNDASYATPEEAAAALRYAVARRPCLARHIESLGQVDSELAALRSDAAAASDQDMIDLAAGGITWGELNRREQDRSRQMRSMVEDITQRIETVPRDQPSAKQQTDQREEHEHQQQINRSFQAWNNKQQAINAMLPEATKIMECVMSNGRITCQSRLVSVRRPMAFPWIQDRGASSTELGGRLGAGSLAACGKKPTDQECAGAELFGAQSEYRATRHSDLPRRGYRRVGGVSHGADCH
jgi:hypothetical protein